MAGHSQASIINFEQELVDHFGPEEGLADRLRFPVFLSSLTPGGLDAVRRIRARLPANATRYIRDFHDGLDHDVAEDMRFEFRILLVPLLGPESEADLTVNCVQAKALTTEQRSVLESLGKSGLVATRIKRQPVQNVWKYKPKRVAEQVVAHVPGFTMAHHTWSWKHQGVRSQRGARDRTATDSMYCVWDEPHGDHLYTDA